MRWSQCLCENGAVSSCGPAAESLIRLTDLFHQWGLIALCPAGDTDVKLEESTGALDKTEPSSQLAARSITHCS